MGRHHKLEPGLFSIDAEPAAVQKKLVFPQRDRCDSKLGREITQCYIIHLTWVVSVLDAPSDLIGSY